MSASLVQGSEFAGHRIEGELGRGGMAIVYRARHLSLDQPRALKVISPELHLDPAATERFRQEARLAATIDHPSAVRAYDAGDVDGVLYISMQLIDGADLSRVLEAGPLTPKRAVRILAQVAAGLDAAHRAGLVHRDVKPENILLTEGVGPGGERAYLGDFGIGTLFAGRRGERLTGESRIIGTASYISPEQIAGGPVDGRADIYSLGCVAFEVLTGTVPFPAETQLATLAAHSGAPRPSACERNPALPGSVDRELELAMAVDPERRPVTATEFVQRLGAALGVSAVESDREPTRALPDPGPPPAESSGSRRRKPEVAVAALVLVAALIAAAVLVLPLGGDGPPARMGAAVTADVPRDPVSVAAGASYVWIASKAAGRITALDGADGAKQPLGQDLAEPRALALGPGYLWAVSPKGLFRLPLDGAPATQASVPDLADPVDVAVAPEGIFVLDRGGEGEPRVVRVDPETLEQTGEAFVGQDPQALAFGAKSIWVANTGDGTVSRIDPGEVETLGRPIEVGGRPQSIAASGGQVWVIDNFGGVLTPIDPAGEEPSAGEPIETLPRPRGVALGFGSVWVASGERGVVQRFDEGGDHELQAEVTVGSDPAAISVGGDRVWTADSESGTASGIDP